MTHIFETAGLGSAPFTFVGNERKYFQACPGAPLQCGGSCDYCGTGIVDMYHIQSSDGRSFKVGCECVKKTGDLGLIAKIKQVRSARAKALRVARNEAKAKTFAARSLEMARIRRQAARKQANAFAQAHGLIPAFKVALKGAKRAMAKELLGKLIAFGHLSVATVDFIKSLGTKLPPAPVGRVVFSGEIVKVKHTIGAYGPQTKIIVQSDDGWRCWVSCPVAILRDAPKVQGISEDYGNLKGLRVQLTATLEQSKDDAGFAFGKRPSGKILKA